MYDRGMGKHLNLVASWHLGDHFWRVMESSSCQSQTKIYGTLGKGQAEIGWIATCMIFTKIFVGEFVG